VIRLDQIRLDESIIQFAMLVDVVCIRMLCFYDFRI